MRLVPAGHPAGELSRAPARDVAMHLGLGQGRWGGFPEE